MRSQPLIAVHNVEVSSSWYQRLLDCQSGHGGTEYERLVDEGELILQIHHWDAHEHPHMGDPKSKPYGNGVLIRYTARTELRVPTWVRSLIPLALVLLPASAAQAQRIPEVVVWSVGASLFAPFVAVPVKLGVSRLMALDATTSRLWAISAVEWLLWFPITFLVLRSGRSSFAPLTVLALFGSAAWLHKALVANASWRSAIFLALPTPVLALLLPFPVMGLAFYLESLAV